MPLTATGKKVLKSMQKQYGRKKGTQVFHSSINKGVAGSSKWHSYGKKKKGNPHPKKKDNPDIDEHPAKRMDKRMANLDKARRGVFQKSRGSMDFSHM